MHYKGEKELFQSDAIFLLSDENVVHRSIVDIQITDCQTLDIQSVDTKL
jgi:hypothetical protein